MSEWEKFKTIPFEIKTFEEKEDRYEFKGYASVFHTPDRDNDIVEPGAFKRTMDHHNSKFPLCWMHDRKMIIGGVRVEEDTKGWFVNPGTLIKGVRQADEAYKLMKAGVIDGMSFAYRAIQKQYKSGRRHLKELAVGEVTLGPRSMIAHPDALITEVKFNVLDEFTSFMKDSMETKIWEDKEDWTEIRYRVRDPNLFVRIRPKWLVENSIRAMGGPLKTGGGWTTQALRFQKSAGWTLSKAKKWVRDHPDLKLDMAMFEYKVMIMDSIPSMTDTGMGV